MLHLVSGINSLRQPHSGTSSSISYSPIIGVQGRDSHIFGDFAPPEAKKSAGKSISALNNLDSVIDKYQTFLDNLWLADWCHQWLSEHWSCTQVTVITSFLLVAAFAYSWWFFEFFGVTTVNISFRQLIKFC